MSPSPRTDRRRRGAALALTFGLIALLGAACGDDGGTASSSSTTAAGTPTTGGATPATTAAPTPITVKMLAPGNHGIVPYGQKTGAFEAELAKVNAKVEWVKGPGAFSANLDAMKAGNINTAQAAVAPVIGALIANLDFKIFAIAEPAPDITSAGIVATKQSGITSIQGLVGKRVAVNPAAKGEYMLLKALEEAGIPFDRVTRVPIQPAEATAAFTSGSIDAWSTFGVFFQQAINQAGGVVLKYEKDFKSDDVGIISANAKVLEQNPAAFRAIIDVYNRLVDESRQSPEKFQNVFEQSGPTAVSGAVLQQQIEDQKKLPKLAAANPEGIKRVQGVLDIFAKAGVLQRSVAIDSVVFDVKASASK